MTRTVRGKPVILARGRTRPLFRWNAGEPFSWDDPALARQVPPTHRVADADDLAWGATRHVGAEAVLRADGASAQLPSGGMGLSRARYLALSDLEVVVLPPAPARQARVCAEVGWTMKWLSGWLQDLFVRYGSAAGRDAHGRLEQDQAYVAALARHLAPDLAETRAELEALVREMDAWMLRTAIPGDEVLRLSIAPRAVSEAWTKNAARAKKR